MAEAETLKDEESILLTVKKMIGLASDYNAFDLDLTVHINSVLFTLYQLGVGPASAFSIEDKSSKWEDFLGTDPNLAGLKTYIASKVRLMFDPPTSSAQLQSLENVVKEFEWRLYIEADTRATPVIGEVVIIE